MSTKQTKKTLTLTLTLDGNLLSMFAPRVTESTVLAALAPLAVGELVHAWIDECQADAGTEPAADPLRDHEIRNAQWNALRQGRPIPSFAQANAFLDKARG